MVKVYASASIGNIGVGFDVLGLALLPIDGSFLGDIISIEHADIFEFFSGGRYFRELPTEIKKNIVYQSWEIFCGFLGRDVPVSIFLEKNVPISSGLGSSACSVVATLAGMNAYCGNPLDKNQLLGLMAEIEGKFSGSIHFDNIAPCFLGGLQMILQESNVISQRVPIFSNWLWVVSYPGVKISTIEARSILPTKYSRDVCITHSRYLSGFIHACHTRQESLAIQLMKDVIAEPYRSVLLPDFFFIRKNVLNLGALMCGISGSGPTLFALSNNQDVAMKIALWFSKNYLKNCKGFVHICRLNLFGVRILMK